MPKAKLPPTVQLINEQRRQILDQKKKIADLRWECRSLRARLYAESHYRERYLGLHDSGDTAHSDPPAPDNGSAA
jgi:hypothetical protein